MADSGSHGLTDIPSPSLSRRDLLLLGAAGAASIVLTGAARVAPALDLSPLTGLLGAARQPFTIGFWDRGSAGESAQLIDAGTISSGSARFATDGARVSILGLYPRADAAALGHLESVAIDVLYAPYHDLEFRAWEFTNGATPRVGSPIAVNVPVDADAGLSVRLTYRLTGADAATSSTATFALGSDPRAMKLREGVYLIALPDANAALPSWSHYRAAAIGAGDRGPRALHRRDWYAEQARPSSQPYVMLSIE
jgi:hypothetical protein